MIWRAARRPHLFARRCSRRAHRKRRAARLRHVGLGAAAQRKNVSRAYNRSVQLAALIRAYTKGRRDFRAIELSGDFIRGLQLTGCDFSGAHLSRCVVQLSTFTDCTFSGANFDETGIGPATFTHCDFDSAMITRSTLSMVSFTSGSMSDVGFHEDDVRDCTFANVVLNRSRFLKSRLGAVKLLSSTFAGGYLDDVVFTDSRITDLCEAPSVTFESDCTVDWGTVVRSLSSPALRSFLLRAGTPEPFAEALLDCAWSVDTSILDRMMRSTFISYGGPDAKFAKQLAEELRRHGVDAFFFETDAVPGQRLHDVMRRGVNGHERILLICSAASLQRPGVQNEIQQTLMREARDGGASYLIPITLDDFFLSWDPASGVGQEIRDRVVANFKGAEADREKFDEAFRRLLQALRKDPAG
jgi:uncharacterized protein YjbI with pentapeptide repeats